jgi:hypothetical protein
MKATIDVNGMIKTHNEWGGSHDIILGFMLWILCIPVYGFSTVHYRTDRMRTGSLDRLKNRYTRLLHNAIVVHDVCSILQFFLNCF